MEVHMKTVWKWIFGILAVIVAASLVLLPLVGRMWFGWMPMMGYGVRPMHPYWGWSSFAGWMMAGRFLIPLIVIGLFIWGGVALIRSAGAKPAPPPQTTACTHCGQPLQVGWVACPYCGEKV